MHSIPAAWLLVNVRVDDPAVVVNDWRVADDFVIHDVFGLRLFFSVLVYANIHIYIYVPNFFLFFFLRLQRTNALSEKIFLEQAISKP
jgi:hypothetical protein